MKKIGSITILFWEKKKKKIFCNHKTQLRCSDDVRSNSPQMAENIVQSIKMLNFYEAIQTNIFIHRPIYLTRQSMAAAERKFQFLCFEIRLFIYLFLYFFFGLFFCGEGWCWLNF
jgi:hypothetical protein